MSLHRSLKTKPIALAQHRNVLTRAERITKLTETEKFAEGRSPLGLPKVANRMAVAAKKPKKEAVEGEAAAAAPGAAGAAPAAGAPAAKGAAPAAKTAPAAKPAGKK
jgi:small basic protein (TIGR04137 family)